MTCRTACGRGVTILTSVFNAGVGRTGTTAGAGGIPRTLGAGQGRFPLLPYLRVPGAVEAENEHSL